MKNPAGTSPRRAVDDRQWLAFYGPNTVYLLYRTVAPAGDADPALQRRRLTYGPARTAGAIGQVGSIDVDSERRHRVHRGQHREGLPGVPSIVGGEPLTYTCTQAASDPGGVAHLFFIVKVAPEGTVYVAYSNDHDIFLAHSTDKGQTWSLPSG